MMAVELGKSPYLSLLSDARMSQTLRLMVRPADTKLTPDVAAEICERTGKCRGRGRFDHRPRQTSTC